MDERHGGHVWSLAGKRDVMLFRILFNILILLLLVRLLRPLAHGIGRYLKRVTGSDDSGGRRSRDTKIDYSDLTPYEIEDADFEEVKTKRK
ncbi:MAG: hypothetical protein P8181_13090 [bacterium]